MRAPTPQGGLSPFTVVTVFGLQSAESTKYNNASARVQHYCVSGRYLVEVRVPLLFKGKHLLLKRENLIVTR